MKAKVLASGLAVISTVYLANSPARAEDPEPKGAEQAYSTVSDRGITLQWKVEGETLRVKVAAPTTGWVAVGFDPGRVMKGANIIIGYVKDGQVSLRDDFGKGMFSHQADSELGGKDNITGPEGQEENGATEIGFIIPLNSGEGQDKPLVPGKTCQVILAAGGNGADDFSSKHKKIGKVEIKL